ncbi:MAG: right-handed parallel beta-helix repeat-containing protein [Candidatus Thermoplasmatota archaeon]|nr:right-handed parallel beta-helix repeat-containing protein [Candidatus Thermoplasmatota archaeon]
MVRFPLLRKGLVVGVLLLLIGISIPFSVLAHTTASVVFLYIPHEPIRIDGNDNFTVHNGVTEGEGTLENPYLIEGWELNGTLHQASASGISITDTDCFFIIRNCYIHHFNVTGIQLDGVINGQVDSCIVSDADQFHSGIYITNCSLVTLSDNVIISNTYGIEIQSSTYVVVHNNTLSAEILSSFTGIDGSCSHCTISNNTVGRDYNEGIILSGRYNVVTGNSVSGYHGLGTTGIQVTGQHNRVCYNTLKGLGSGYSGVGIRSNSDSNFNNTIDHNSVMYNSLGVQLHGSYFSITHNVIRYNDKGLVLWISDNSTVENNSVSYNDNPDNGGYGIAVTWCSEQNTIQNNEVYKNLIGMVISGSSRNVFSWNTITSRTYGVYMHNAQNVHTTQDNEIHHNAITGGNYGFYITEDTRNNLFSYNELSATTMGVYLQDASAHNTFYRNNFLDIVEEDVCFELRPLYRTNTWVENYWGSSLTLPKIIIGRVGIFFMKIPWINIDWHPAQEPYDRIE